MPEIGFQLVIDSPLSVSRVIPPTTTIRNTIAATASNQRATPTGFAATSAGLKPETARKELDGCVAERMRGI